MSNPIPAMTEAEHDHLANYRNPRLLLDKAEKIAQALHDLSQPENEVVFPAARYWLADELCSTLERLALQLFFEIKYDSMHFHGMEHDDGRSIC